ncbi:hypothetical protein GW17_00029833 [Ensete ventricosum]|nr:hypothetical protein GW17_00029833 [Ensete ventricosum]
MPFWPPNPSYQPTPIAHSLLRLGRVAADTTTMPGIPAAAATLSTPADLFSFDDDDGFGDFIFASSDQPLPPHQQQDADDWGEFVVGPLGSQRFEFPATPPPLLDAFPSHSAAVVVDEIAGVKEWEKPRGALPLSIFGEEEVNEPQPLQPLDLCSPSFSSSSPAADHKGQVAGGELRDLITSLYGHAPQPVGVDRIGSRLAEGKEDDTDESSWEYKDASSSSPNSVLKLKMVLITMMHFCMVVAWFNIDFSSELIDQFSPLFV